MADLNAQIALSADATGVEAGVGRAKRSLKDLGATAQTEGKKASDGLAGIGTGGDTAAKKVESSTKSLINSIQRATAAMEAGSKSGSDYYRVLASQRGISTDALKPYLDQLDAVTAKQKAASTALTAGNATLNATGMSAKATAAALRGVPAQFTDIVTSIQGRQAPLTVFLQQGGQLKDMFGGIGPAARALGGYVARLVTPFTLAASAVGALAIAMYQGSKESEAYAKALVLTGNSIGKTADQLHEMAANIAKITGTQGDAAEALSAMAQSGKIASSSFNEVGAAVVSMSRVMGTSIDDAVGQFVKLADQPAKASAELNDKLHYLNLTTYERIRALEEQGDKEGAAALAQRSLAEATTTRMAAVEMQAGVLARAWRALTKDAKEAWDMMSGLGRPETTGEKLAGLQKQLSDRQARGSLNSLTGSAFDKGNAKLQADITSLSRQSLREQENAYAEGQRARDQAAKIAASDRLSTLTKEIQTNADKRKKAIADLNRDYQTLGKDASGAEYDKLVANINEKYKDPKGAKVKAFQDDAGTKALETLRQQEAALKEQLSINDKLTAADQERAKYIQLFADLKDKKVLTADQKSLVANQAAILAQLDQNVAVEKQLELKKEAAKLDEKRKRDAEEFKRQIDGINISIASSSESRAEQQSRALEAFGLGDRARQEVEAQRSIRTEYERYQRELTKAASDKNQLGSDAYKAEVENIKKSLGEALKAQESYFAALKEKQEDWRNGATSALANYVDQVNDAASRAKSLLSNSLSGLNESITDALWSGNLDSFKKFGDSIGKQILSGIVQQQVTKPIAEWLQGSLKDDDSIISKLFGGLTSNKGTGEDWLGGLLGTSKKSESSGSDPLGDFIGSLTGGIAGSAKDRGANASNPLYVRFADAISSVTGGGSISGGGGLLGEIFSGASSLFGGFSNSTATSMANITGGGLDDLLKYTNMFSGFDDGGFTGAGGKNQPAGIVHAGEYVVNAENTRRLGLGFLERLNKRGYADGGYVGAVMGGNLSEAGGATTNNSKVEVHNHFAAGTDSRTIDQATLKMARVLNRSQRNA